ncbi:MAG TPA: DUF515 domain-containing protein [Methanothermococcus okinawensis]|nr:DUF515 domain-containing protein [Methanothermococcus okinawensis]
MANNSFSDKLKRIKTKSKRIPKVKPNIIIYLIMVISIVLISFMAYNIYQMEMMKRAEDSKKLEEAKITGINSLKQMFSHYPDDPRLNIYINDIENSNSEEEIKRILSDAENYIKLKRYKEEIIENIKSIYGKYYFESLYARYIVNKIQKASSTEEIDLILKKSNIEENAKMYYLNSIENSIHPDKYYALPVFEKKTIMSGKELIDYVKKLNLEDIKNLKIIPVSFNKVALVVPAPQCGKIPFEGSKIEIYDRENVSMEPIPGIVNSSYVIVSDINYRESKSVSSTLSEDSDTTTLSTTSDIEYSLQNVPGVLYATAAGKLDYYKIIDKFGRYGEKLNKITSDTQIFDKNAKYLLIVSIPSDDIPKLLSIKDIYIVRVE